MKLHPYADDYFNHRLCRRNQWMHNSQRRTRERKRLRQEQKRTREILRLLQPELFPPRTRTVDTLRICHQATYWYQAYMLHPKLQNPRFHKYLGTNSVCHINLTKTFFQRFLTDSIDGRLTLHAGWIVMHLWRNHHSQSMGSQVVNMVGINEKGCGVLLRNSQG